MTKAYYRYNGEEIEVIVKSTFQGGSGMIANIEAVDGFPFNALDVAACGPFDKLSAKGYRVRTAFIRVEEDNPIEAMLSRRETILAIFADEPVSKETANELIDELAEIEINLQRSGVDVEAIYLNKSEIPF